MPPRSVHCDSDPATARSRSIRQRHLFDLLDRHSNSLEDNEAVLTCPKVICLHTAAGPLYTSCNRIAAWVDFHWVVPGHLQLGVVYQLDHNGPAVWLLIGLRNAYRFDWYIAYRTHQVIKAKHAALGFDRAEWLRHRQTVHVNKRVLRQTISPHAVVASLASLLLRLTACDAQLSWTAENGLCLGVLLRCVTHHLNQYVGVGDAL
mmetsp:Transcript_109578/g.217594  ORF Transcript_109578/g.217594 Transcript_109578/m.217594 type:complete len:205 (+) Transcript_109578:649-1263(+)